MSITTTRSRLTRRYLERKSKDDLIVFALQQADAHDAFIRRLKSDLLSIRGWATCALPPGVLERLDPNFTIEDASIAPLQSIVGTIKTLIEEMERKA